MAAWGRGPVLVVDDDPDCLALSCMTIGREFPGLTADCGDDALRIARSVGPALIIIDIVMPGGMDGLSLPAKLKSSAETREIPVIVFSELPAKTGLAVECEAFQRYLGGAPDAIVEKPALHGELLTAVRALLGRGAADDCLSRNGSCPARGA